VHTILDNGKKVIGIFYTKKSFDSVDHKILINKLDFYDIRGKDLDLFTSYLNDRSQFVRIINTFKF